MMAYIAMAYIVMACIVMAYIGRATIDGRMWAMGGCGDD